MPWGDRTGPAGAGPMTGKGAGFCAGNSVPGSTTPRYNRFFGDGSRLRRGCGRGFGRQRIIEQDLQAINHRLEQLEKKET